MAEDGRPRDRRGRRQRRLLTPQHKYKVFLQLACRESTTMAEVARRWEVDPNTILRIREVGKQAALEELANSRPGRLRNGEDQVTKEVTNTNCVAGRSWCPAQDGPTEGPRSMLMSGKKPKYLSVCVEGGI